MRRTISKGWAGAALAAVLGLGLATSGPARAAGPEGELIDRVWAGHPVTFAFLTERGHQFIAYYDAERRITVAGRKLPDGPWQRVQPEGVPVPARKRASNTIAWDSHNYLRLALDRDGYLHLAGNMHVDPLVYYRSERPLDVTALRRIDRMTGERETRCTYPVFFRTPAGDLVFRYRDGNSGNGSDLYNIYDPDTRTWRRVLETPLLDGEGERNAYASEPLPGPDGRFHLAWVWRETPDCATNHSLSYARSRDFRHWENSRGEPLPLPITLAKGDIVDAAPPGGGLINMTFALGFDAAQRPVLTYHRYDAAGKSQAYAARPNGRGWDVQQLSAWNFRWAFSGGGSIPAEVRVGPARAAQDGSLTVDFSTQAAGGGRWRIDGKTLAPLETLPPLPGALPAELRRVRTPGMEVQTLTSRGGEKRWVLRWETLPRNRDKPREVAPAPTELRLYALPEAETEGSVRVGS